MNVFNILSAVLLFAQATPPAQNPSPKKDDVQVESYMEYRNPQERIAFKIDNGRVELTVPAEKGKATGEELTTYKAASMEEFKRQYPEIAKKYTIDRLLPGIFRSDVLERSCEESANRLLQEEKRVGKSLRELFKDAPMNFGFLDRWFDEAHPSLRDFERRMRDEDRSSAQESFRNPGPRLGILVGPVSEPLRAQLGLQANEGLVVEEVEKGSLAEASGLKDFDVLVKLSGQVIGDSRTFRDQVMTALHSKDCVLDIIRHGTPLKVTIHPAHS
jgi:hypothetical protein